MDDQANGSDKKTRHRSPNYPAVGLSDAVDRLQKLYAKDGRAGAPAEIAAVHIGFGKAHGQAMSVLSALKKFGLVSEVNGRIAPTQRGLEIVNLTAGDPRRAKALKEAVMEPPAYRELIEQHRDTGWPSDEALSSELVTYKGFNPNSAPYFVRDLKASLEYAGLSSGLALESTIEDDGMPEVDQARQESTREAGAAKTPPAVRLTPEQQREQLKGTGQRTPVGSEIPVAKDCVMGVNAAGRVTQEGIEKLIAYLGLIKGSFPKESENVQ